MSDQRSSSHAAQQCLMVAMRMKIVVYGDLPICGALPHAMTRGINKYSVVPKARMNSDN